MNQIEVYGYARKSPDDKEDTQTSIENQIKLFNKTCLEKNWKLVHVFIDSNVSGSDRDRKEFSRMLKEFYSNDVKFILVKEQNRFARDSSVMRDTLIDINARNKAVYSILKGGFLSHEDLGDSVTAVVDDYYILSSRKKAESTFTLKRDEGLPPTVAPFGYKNNKKTKSWDIVPKEAELVRKVCEDLILKINYKQTLKNLNLSPGKYYRIIKNIKNGVYLGLIYYERKIKDSNKTILRIEKVSYKGIHEPLITKELFDKVNEMQKM
jgi:DNA invertase Pin-like site-specific DNA recombinase